MRHLFALFGLFALLTLLALSAPARADDPLEITEGRTADNPRLYRIPLTPADPVTPALRYRLLPTPLEIVRGNAAPLYIELAPALREVDVDPLSEVATADLPRSGAGAKLNDLAPLLARLDEAARRNRADWPAGRDVNAVMDYLNPMRNAANIVHLRTRLAIAEKRYDDAVRSMQTEFAMARHMAEDAPLIHGLVATGMAALGTQGVREMMAQPDAPSLYWALSSLPRPLIDPQTVLEGERRWISQRLPSLRLPRDQIKPETWQQLASELMNLGMTLQLDAGADPDAVELRRQMGAAAMAMAAIVPARQWLGERGLSEQELADMPPPKIVAIYYIASFNEAFDELAKWNTLPPWMAQDGMPHDARLRTVLHEQQFSNTVLTMMVPSLARARETILRIDRDVQALQTIEAIRAHAAAHGAPPARLADIRAWPALPDPMTGRPFDYAVTDTGFMLAAPSPAPNRPQDGFIYEVRLQQ